MIATAHQDDANAVAIADTSSQIIYSGGDDGICKVWDRRTLSETRPTPVGILAGHKDGITYIDAKVWTLTTGTPTHPHTHTPTYPHHTHAHTTHTHHTPASFFSPPSPNTHAQGDSRYLITNSKDQSIKLWDVRKFSPREGMEATLSRVQQQTWDYRWQNVPKIGESWNDS